MTTVTTTPLETSSSRRSACLAEVMNQVHPGDFLELSAMVEGEKFDLVIADPPYNIGKDFGNDSDRQELEQYLTWTDQVLDRCWDLLRTDGLIYWYGFPEILAHVAVRYPIDQQRWLVWHYTNKAVPSLSFWQRSHESILCLWKGVRPQLNIDEIREGYTDSFLNSIGKPRKESKGRYNTKGRPSTYNGHTNGAMPRDVLKVPALAGGAGHKERRFLCYTCESTLFPPDQFARHQEHDYLKHPTQKPQALTERLLRSKLVPDRSAQVLIPFAGSGSECVVAKLLGVDFFSTEINPAYAELANMWLEHTNSTQPLALERG